MDAPECRLCQARHWGTEPHALAGVTPRVEVRDLLTRETRRDGLETRNTTRNAPPETRNVRLAPAERVTASECGHMMLKPKRGPLSKFCSMACKQAAYRKRASRA